MDLRSTYIAEGKVLLLSWWEYRLQHARLRVKSEGEQE